MAVRRGVFKQTWIGLVHMSLFTHPDSDSITNSLIKPRAKDNAQETLMQRPFEERLQTDLDKSSVHKHYLPYHPFVHWKIEA